MLSASIIILNWNGWEDTIECLESLYRITYPNYEVIVVDNNSSNNSVGMLKKWAQGKEKISSPYFKYYKKNKPIKYLEYTKEELDKGQYLKDKKKLDFFPSDKKLFILKNDKNYGFTGGNNIALNQILNEGRSEYILLLNNDTIVSRDFLTELIRVIENRKNVGIVGSKIYNYGFKKRQNIIQSAGSTINLYTGNITMYGGNQIDRKQFDDIRTVDYISGTCLLIKREAVQKIGLLNDKLFAYFEDVDWCLRAKEKKYDIVYAPGSTIWHKGGKTSSKIPELLMYYRVRNRFLIEKRFATLYQYIFFLGFYFFVMVPLWIVRCLIFIKKPKLLKHFLLGLKDGLIRNFIYRLDLF